MRRLFKLEIEIGNDSMQTNRDVAAALREVAKQLDGPYVANHIKDANGNRVGWFKGPHRGPFQDHGGD